MPWCPVCKNEYREGIKICADCNVELVDKLEDPDEVEIVELVSTEKHDLLLKFADYLDYSDIHSYTIVPDQYELVWTMSVSKKDYKMSKKLLHGFVMANNDKKIMEKIKAAEENGEETDDIEEEFFNEETETGFAEEFFETDEEVTEGPENTYEGVDPFESAVPEDDDEDSITFNAPTSAYVRKSERYTEYRFSSYTCILVGFLGSIFCLLNIFGIFSFVPALFSQIVLLAVFIAFLVGGIVIFITSNKIKSEIGAEENTENEIKSWLTENITPEFLESIKDEDVSDEVNYFSYTEKTTEMLREAYPDAPDDMVETLIDEHLSGILS